MRLFVLLTLVLAAAAELQWTPFSKDSRADVVVDFSEMDMERMFVRYPCDDNIWFKLFISSGHIELFSKNNGNIFCKEGGSRNWYSGDRTDFTMAGVVCDDGGKYVNFVIEKTLSSLKIKNIGDTVVYEQQFDSTDGLCTTTPTTRIKTQVWKYDGSLDLAFLDNFFLQAADSEMHVVQWTPFSIECKADVKVDFSGMDVERMFVRYPCGENIWFKLFISSGHIEVFSKTKGNIFCKEGGTKNWYGGDRTDFTMAGVVCEKGDEYVMFVFEKTASNLKIKNRNVVVYEQDFDDTDGLCHGTPTTRITTQVWSHAGNLELSYLDNDFPDISLNGPYLPEWPGDFKWSHAGEPEGYDCIQIIESAAPLTHTWRDNYFCWRSETADPGFRWSSSAQYADMRCTRIYEDADPHTWDDNYLCVPTSSPYNLEWSQAGPIADKECIQWVEPADPHAWQDNYLCA